MDPRELALRFVRAFAAGDLAGLTPLFADDLRVTGPYLTAAGRADYLAGLERDPPDPAEARVLSVTADGDEAAVFYEYVRPGTTRLIAQLFRVRDGMIHQMVIVFDTATPG